MNGIRWCAFESHFVHSTFYFLCYFMNMFFFLFFFFLFSYSMVFDLLFSIPIYTLLEFSILKFRWPSDQRLCLCRSLKPVLSLHAHEYSSTAISFALCAYCIRFPSHLCCTDMAPVCSAVILNAINRTREHVSYT